MGNIDELVLALVKKNMSEKEALQLLKANHIFWKLSSEEIEKNVFVLFNGPFLYAVMYCVDNNYEWCVFDRKKGIFSKMKDSNIEDNYIIRMVINGVNKLAQLIGLENETLQIKMLNASSKLSSGYKIR